ncbi:MAG: polysaccharide synthesis protein exod [Ponticaulis sp.]|nr:polysaccharide synthesis protein exod [Ponticaulis sp.]
MTEQTQTSDSEGSILTVLDRLADSAPEDGLSLAQIMEALDERAFGAILFALAIPCCIPFLYGVPQIVALPMMAIAFQMVMGRSEPWMPAKFSARQIDRAGLTRIAKGGRSFFGWAEKIASPRLTFLAHHRAQRIVGAILCLFCGSILVPLPLTNSTPGFAVAMVAFGLMALDGAMMLLGMVIGLAWIGFLLILGPVALKELIKALIGVF